MSTLDALPMWAVMMANHLCQPGVDAGEPMYRVREFPGATRAEAYAAAQAYGAETGDCSPSGGVEDVEGPMDGTVPTLDAHPVAHGACDPETPCADCATAYGRLDAAEGDAGLLEAAEG